MGSGRRCKRETPAQERADSEQDLASNLRFLFLVWSQAADGMVTGLAEFAPHGGSGFIQRFILVAKTVS